ASTSQKVALNRSLPPLIPNRRHMASDASGNAVACQGLDLPRMPDRRALASASRVLARRAALESRSAVYAWRAGMLALDRPDKALAILRAMDRLGQLGAA